METVADYFGSYVFNDEVMKERLPKEIYKALKKTVMEGKIGRASCRERV